jgi:signal peptidase I
MKLLFFVPILIGAAFIFFLASQWELRVFTVISGSMMPELKPGNVILVFRDSRYRLNDIVTYSLGTQFVTHRIVYIGDYYLTKGDANILIDPQHVSKSQIIGKVIFSMPRVGVFLLILVPALLIITHEGFVIYQKIRFD